MISNYGTSRSFLLQFFKYSMYCQINFLISFLQTIGGGGDFLLLLLPLCVFAFSSLRKGEAVALS